MSHPERGTKMEAVPEWEGWTSSGCPRRPPRCGRCCCQRSGLHPPTEERCLMLCSGECGSWAWWSRQRRNSRSFSGHKGYFLKPAQGAPEFPPSCLVCADLPDSSSLQVLSALLKGMDIDTQREREREIPKTWRSASYSHEWIPWCSSPALKPGHGLFNDKPGFFHDCV